MTITYIQINKDTVKEITTKERIINTAEIKTSIIEKEGFRDLIESQKVFSKDEKIKEAVVSHNKELDLEYEMLDHEIAESTELLERIEWALKSSSLKDLKSGLA